MVRTNTPKTSLCQNRRHRAFCLHEQSILSSVSGSAQAVQTVCSLLPADASPQEYSSPRLRTSYPRSRDSRCFVCDALRCGSVLTGQGHVFVLIFHSSCIFVIYFHFEQDAMPVQRKKQGIQKAGVVSAVGQTPTAYNTGSVYVISYFC